MRLRLLLCCWLVGCSSQTFTPVSTASAPVAVPNTEPLTLNPVQWQTVTAAQLNALAAKLPPGTPLFVLDETNYKNWALNLIEIERYITEQKAVLEMLKNINEARAKGGTPP